MRTFFYSRGPEVKLDQAEESEIYHKSHIWTATNDSISFGVDTYHREKIAK
jgi:hypothetical protein